MVLVEKKQSFVGHQDSIYTLALFQDGFLSAGAEGVVAYWKNIAQDHATALFKAQHAIYTLYFDQLNDTIIAGQNEGTLIFFNLKSQQAVSKKGHSSAIFGITALNDNEILTVSKDGCICCWNRETYELVYKEQVSNQGLRCVSYSNKYKQIIMGGSDAYIRTENIETKERKEYLAHDNTIFDLQVLNNRIYSVGRDAMLKTLDLTTLSIIKQIPAHNYSIHTIKASPNGTYLATGSMDKTIKIWHRESLELLKVIDFARHQAHKSSVNSLIWVNDDLLLSASDDKMIYAWELSFNY